jgi:signal transduction histidine kinase
MVANLVGNARRFAVTRVEVTVAREGSSAILRVRDDGPGVAPADRARIFERFVRLDEARDRGDGGFGLGLAIVADLCRAYGGTVEVGDAGPGAVFTIRFPLARGGSLRRRLRQPTPV